MLIKKIGIVIFLFISINIYADYSLDSNSDGVPDIWVEELGEDGYIISSDTNFDGDIDAVLTMDSNKISQHEETDYNLDGTMDNFYYYKDGFVVRQEVDSNYDKKIDIWVYIVNEGRTISRYEKDLDFDGVVDKVKEFEVEEDGE